MTTMLPESQDVFTTSARPLAPDGLPGPVFGSVVVLPDVKLGRRPIEGATHSPDIGVVSEESSLQDLLDVIGQAMETVGTEQARRNLGEIAARLGRFQAVLSTWCDARDAAITQIESRTAAADQRESRLEMREVAAAEREAISRLRDDAFALRESTLQRDVREFAARQRRFSEREADLHRRECAWSVAVAARVGRWVAVACDARGLLVTRRREGVGQRAVAGPRSSSS